LRIEDIDPPREEAGATERIIETLRRHGFQWTGEILYQNRNRPRFEAVIKQLLANEAAYPCTCTRKKVRGTALRNGRMGPVYPGTCRAHLGADAGMTETIRLRTTDHTVSFDDGIRGTVACEVATDIGDFIIRRRDGLMAYSLAVVVDDHDQGITEVVRGEDLLDFTPAQIALQRILGLDTPAYLHVPIAMNPDGEKLSKQTGAAAVDNAKAAENLFRCLEFLKQQPPASLRTATSADIWAWAIPNWRAQRLAKPA
jgi:glutamyl-Q tRNA(Asp) synthetase